MTKTPTINLIHKTSGWVAVQSANALPATYAYMFRFSRFMDLVCFGDEAIPNMGTRAVKMGRLPALKAHIENHGLLWNEMH